MSFFESQMKEYQELIEVSLDKSFPKISGEHKNISTAARYSLLAGGKRIRPIFSLATAKMLNLNFENVIPFACAIEMIHTFSLIHDDLPGMDNDDLRRGKPTCHVVFGEALAILAGDVLLNKAFDNMLIFSIADTNKSNIKAIQYISKCTGENGMIGGQVIDIESENRKVQIDVLKQMHKMKTGALLKAPIIVSAILANIENDIVEILDKYADFIGMAFQIQDDILDYESTTSQMGKTVGKDFKNNKSTYVSILGIDNSKNILKETINNAIEQLKQLQTMDFEVDFLMELTYYLLNRKS